MEYHSLSQAVHLSFFQFMPEDKKKAALSEQLSKISKEKY